MHNNKPKTIAFEISSDCRFDCIYCDRRNWQKLNLKRTRPFMDINQYKQIIDEVTEWKTVPSITLSYEGESILNPQFNEYLKYLGSKDIRPWISTRELSDDDDVLNLLLECCSAICVSLDDDKTYTLQNQKKGESNKDLEKRLLKLIQLAEKNCSQTSLSVSIVVFPPETPESPRVRDFIAEWIDSVHEIFLWQKIDFSQGIKYSYRDGIEKHLRRRRVCEQPFSYLAVLSDGRISPCCNTSRIVFNSLNISKGLTSALESEEYQNFLEKHLSLQLLNTACQECELWLDSWLGDEKYFISLDDGRQCQVFFEGSSYRIKGKS